MNPNSIVDYLASQGQKTDFASRAQLAASKGIQGYAGTAQQNIQLLNTLRAGTPAPQPTNQAAPKPQAQGATSPGTSGVIQTASGAGMGQPQNAQDLVNMGFSGYQGWDNAGALANFKATGGQGKGGPQTAGGGGSLQGFSQPTINLPQLYESFYANSGIKDIEGELSGKSKAYADQVNKIKNNPYLSEATMSGRLSKLQDKFNADTANLQKDIQTRKADIETRLNLETKQFDINSQQAQQSLSQFNTLLQMGALSGASGEDIASITRSTGISSSAINAAINAQKKKDAKTQVIQVDDGKTVSAVVINPDTGEIINKTVLAQSKPTGGSGGQSSTKSAQQLKPVFIEALQSKANSYGHVSPSDWTGALNSWVARGGNASDFVASFSHFTDPNRGDFGQAYGFDAKQRGVSQKTDPITGLPTN